MIRRILTLLLLLLIITGIVYLFNYYQQARKPVREAIASIPGDAVFILESRKTRLTCQKLQQANQMWEELCTIPGIRDVNVYMSAIDSILSRFPEASDMLEDRPFYLSLHPRANGQMVFLFSYTLPEMNKEKTIKELFSAEGTIREKTHEGFNGRIISEVLFKRANRPFYYSINQGVMSGSFSKALVNEALIQTETGLPLTEDPSFSKVYSSAGERSDGNIFIRMHGLGVLHNTYQKSESEDASILSRYGTWTALDISLQTNLLTLNGYSAAGSKDKLGSLLNQEPQELNILRHIPAAVSRFIAYGIGDLSTYLESRRGQLMVNDESGPLEKITLSLMNEYGIDPWKSFLGWSNNEFAAFNLPGTDNEESSLVAIFHAPDEGMARRSLISLCLRVDSIRKERTDSLEYEDVFIYHLRCENPIGEMVGEPLKALNGSFFFIRESYVYFSSSSSVLKSVISELTRSLTINKDPGFNSFFTDNFSPASNIFFYVSIPEALTTLPNELNEEVNEFILKHRNAFRKFDAFAFQLTADKDLFYTNALLRFNPSAKKEITSIWETELDHEVSGTPFLLMNHLNGTRDVFIQDDSSTIYLLSNSGKILWKKDLKEPILGQPIQIDAYQNDKLQIAFTTSHTFYILDRNGKDLPGFPVKLPAKATASLAVFDYDNTKEYRFLIPLENKTISNYSIKGKTSEKWKSPILSAITRHSLKHIRDGAKDYLILADDQGAVVLLNRRGEKHDKLIPPNQSAPDHFYFQKGKDLKRSTIIICDSSGIITRIRMDGKREVFKLIRFNHISGFTMADLDKDGQDDYLLCNDSSLFTFSSAKKLIASFTFSSEITNDPQIFSLPGNKVVCGIVCASGEKIVLVNPLNNDLPELNYKGIGSFSIGDLNKDKRFYIVTAAKGKRIYAWPLRSSGSDFGPSN